MTNFASLGLSPEILKAISKLGFETPTPVQAKIIPHLLSDNSDLVALAQTGTGKTAAFGLPLLQQLDTSSNIPQAIVLSPTRELCLQICRDIKNFSKYMEAVRSVAIYGGTPIGNQLRALENGVHIIVATPGRMHDILRRGKADLSQVRWTVLDEADEMLNMGFEEDLKAILSHIAPDSQKLLFSATMPKQIAEITGKYMQRPAEITIGTRNTGAENVSHEYYMVHARDRYMALKRLVDVNPDIYGLVFCRTRAETQDVATKLIKDGYSADSLHGELTQVQRDRVMKKFRDRSIQILVATDVAARGIDINDLTHVINYQLPDDLESYTHRSGRTGRAGKTGVSIVLINMREKFKIKFIEKKLGKKFEQRPIPSGTEVCEAQLLKLISRVKNVDINHEQIEPYLPAAMEMLSDMSTDELIKRFVSLEFNRFLEYYRNAPDLNTAAQPARRKIDGPTVTLFINVGKLDRFSPKDLMGIINRGAKEQIQVGRINITQKCSFFDIAEKERDRVMQVLDGAKCGNRHIRVEVADSNKTAKKKNTRRSSGVRRNTQTEERPQRERRQKKKKSGEIPRKKDVTANEKKATKEPAKTKKNFTKKRGKRSDKNAEDIQMPAWARNIPKSKKKKKK
jgi:ATP-dependent RNA helicase DeaD